MPVFRKLMGPALLAALLAATPAAAATVQDVRCFMLSNVFAQKNDKEEGRRLAQFAGFYYLGKLQGMSDAQLRRVIGEEQKKITQATASAEMKRCADAVQASGLHFQSLAPGAQPPATAPRRK